MKYKIELSINKPRAEVWKTFNDPGRTKDWQPSLVSIEPVNGTPGQPGGISKWNYQEGEREFSLTEKITVCEEPHRFESVFENKFAINTVNHVFVEQGSDQTLWVAETKYKFRTLIMMIIGPLLKKNYVARSQRDMQRFKEMVENL